MIFTAVGYAVRLDTLNLVKLEVKSQNISHLWSGITLGVLPQ